MATEAQILANRLSARKSTGPRTPEGKAVVSQNAVKHGFWAKETVIKGEDPGEFEFYRDQMLGELAPVGTLESEMAARIVDLSWRLRRAERLQDEALETLYDKHAAGGDTVVGPAEPSPGLGPGAPADSGAALGRILLEDSAGERVLERLLGYERRIEGRLYRAMAQLWQLRSQREYHPLQGEPAAVNRPCQTNRAPSKAGVIQQVSNPARSKVAARPE